MFGTGGMGTGEVLGVRLCFSCAVVWVGSGYGAGPGSGWVVLYVGIVSLDSLCRWQVHVSVYCAWRIPAHLRCTQCSILLLWISTS